MSRAILGRLANVAFEALYGPAVPLYDWVARAGFAGEWARWQRTVLRFAQTGPTLELGPGTGDLLPILAEHGLAPCGLELSPRMIARARQKLDARSGRRLPLLRGRAEALPFAPDTFGTVVATFPSGWVARPATWAEIARVLRPGGVVAIVLGGELAPHGPGRRVRAAAYRLLYGRRTAPFPAPPASALALRWETVPTEHGHAILLVGRKPA